MIGSKKCNKNSVDCELEIVKNAVDKYQAKIGKRIVHSPEIIEIVNILEDFLRSNRLLCYGGTALNNILPKSDQFYNKDIELPDYDFYSITPKEDAIKLADIYYSKGYTDIEAKSAAHVGTYKVYVNFMPIADITLLPTELFNNIYKNSIIIDKIHYVDANFLRMNIYKELCNPEGDVSRFEKIYKRLLLLNKHYPITRNLNKCHTISYKRTMVNRENVHLIYDTILKLFLKYEIVFFGGHALSIYARYIRSKYIRSQFKKYEPDFDVFSNDPIFIINKLQEKFKQLHIPFSYIKHEPIGEILNTNYEIIVYKDTVGFIYVPNGCYSYNTITLNKYTKINISSIDTMLYMYFIFYHINKQYYNPYRILCMTQLLFKVQVENKYSQIGALTRFPITCYGYQPQIEDIKAEKAKIYNKFKHDKSSEEYQLYFFKYVPNKSLLPDTYHQTSAPTSSLYDTKNKTIKTYSSTHQTRHQTRYPTIYQKNKTHRKPKGIFELYKNNEKKEIN